MNFEILQQKTDNEKFMNDKCPKCELYKMKTWQELSEDEKMVVRVKFSNFSLEQRKKHRFCVNCWFEEVSPNTHA